MIVGTLFIIFIGLLIWSIFYGRKLIRTEKTDTVFGNPAKALGGWHWVIAGVSSILIIWIYFSWDAARAYYPYAANELCQVAKLNRSANPIRSSFPLDDRLLNGTKLLQRNYTQIEVMVEQLGNTNFNDADRAELEAIIADMRAALAAQANPQLIDSEVAGKFSDIAGRINQLSKDISDADYPGPADPAAMEKALAQPGWGESSVEIPALALTDRGRKFDAASLVMDKISKDYVSIKNNGTRISEILQALQARYKAFVIDESGDEKTVAERTAFLRQINKVYSQYFDEEIAPARELVEVANLPKYVNVEISCIASK